MITTEQLDEWTKLCNEATPGPWTLGKTMAGYAVESQSRSITYVTSYDDNEGYLTTEPCLDPSDALFIATARTALPLLLEGMRMLIKELNYLHREVENVHLCYETAKEREGHE